MLEKTIISNYLFDWVEDKEWAILFSICEFMNHSESPNCKYVHSMETKEIEFKTIKDIDPNDEMTVDYGWAWWITHNTGEVELDVI